MVIPRKYSTGGTTDEGEDAVNETRRQLVEKVYRDIATGSIVRDGKLPTERDLAERMGTNRTSMREALIVLETLGVIEVRGKQGLFVKNAGTDRINQSLDLYASWPAHVITQVFQVRIMLESPAAGLAAANRTESDIARLRECLEQFGRVCGNPLPDADREGSRWNDIFHHVVIAATHNEVLIRIHEGLSSTIERVMRTLNRNGLTTPRDEWPERILGEHERIAERIIGRDAAGASAAMQKHLEISAKNMEKLCREHEILNLGASCAPGSVPVAEP